MIEIERKFLVKKPPSDYLSWPVVCIKQGYLAFTEDDIEVRIRQMDNKYYQTLKKGQGLMRGEIEIELTKEQFDKLWPATERKRLIKKRYIKDEKQYKIELDIYEDKLKGLMIVEVEFNSESESRDFSPPDWFDREITDDENYRSEKVAY